MKRALAVIVTSVFAQAVSAEPTALDRNSIPIAAPDYPSITEVDANKVQPPPLQVISPPEKAPNIVVILTDDVGYGVPSTFGGPVDTPTLDRLAQNGLSYTRFHTTALCSPTRSALKAGRNHHMVNVGSVQEIATAFPGNTGQIPNTTAPVAEILRLNGYNTAAFGKWHETALTDTSVSGPQHNWPNRQGFEKFYGFIGAEVNFLRPNIHDGFALVDTDKIRDPDYHFDADIADQAVNWMRAQKTMTPEKPFFVYFATGGVHAPHMVHKKWADKYSGKFDQGWDKLREETLARQLEAGIVPEGTVLAQKPDEVDDWDSHTADERRLYARQAEFFAGLVEHTDYQAGRVVDALEDMGILDDTLVIYISGDNGTSAEGERDGYFNWYSMMNRYPETVEYQLSRLDEWGTITSYPHMAASWAVAFDAPFAWTKQEAGDFGGTRNGTVIHWPSMIKARGEKRTQFSHVIDIAPTILEVAGIPEPEYVNGVKQIPMQGTSLVYTFDNADAEERHKTQYFEMVGNRGIYHEGWFARVIQTTPWNPESRYPITSKEGWELFDLRNDFSLSNNLAKDKPKKLNEMIKVFMEQAVENHVLPLDTRLLDRMDAKTAGRIDLMDGRKSLTVFPGMIGMAEDTFLNVKNTSSRITAAVGVRGDEEANGVILAQGGSHSGWALYVTDGYPAFTYNFLQHHITSLKSSERLPEGESTITYTFDYDGDGRGKGGTAILAVNGKEVARERIERTIMNAYTVDETTDVGVDLSTQVAQSVFPTARDSLFTGTIEAVTVEILE
ncbi:arylsulfatase [Halioglobus sp. HI00S01]|uniref:arylsulfatase n=1 Tax=Halioglobus sp. HI00S01 TaxID=1822214 RepID=UPI001E421BAE|nr:arylsulfatase [Halioglobus sp. HI00S01]